MVRLSRGHDLLRETSAHHGAGFTIRSIKDLWSYPDGIYRVDVGAGPGGEPFHTLTPYVKPKKPEQLKLDLPLT